MIKKTPADQFDELRAQTSTEAGNGEDLYFLGDIPEALEFLAGHEDVTPIITRTESGFFIIDTECSNYFGQGETLEEAQRYLIGAIFGEEED